MENNCKPQRLSDIYSSCTPQVSVGVWLRRKTTQWPHVYVSKYLLIHPSKKLLFIILQTFRCNNSPKLKLPFYMSIWNIAQVECKLRIKECMRNYRYSKSLLLITKIPKPQHTMIALRWRFERGLRPFMKLDDIIPI